jgi:hypothetical protein
LRGPPHDVLLDVGIEDGSLWSTARSVRLDRYQPTVHEATAPECDRFHVQVELRRDRIVAKAIGGQEHDPRTFHQPSRCGAAGSPPFEGSPVVRLEDHGRSNSRLDRRNTVQIELMPDKSIAVH